jgi:hypothetical protein
VNVCSGDGGRGKGRGLTEEVVLTRSNLVSRRGRTVHREGLGEVCRCTKSDTPHCEVNCATGGTQHYALYGVASSDTPHCEVNCATGDTQHYALYGVASSDTPHCEVNCAIGDTQHCTSYGVISSNTAHCDMNCATSGTALRTVLRAATHRTTV